MAIYVGHEVLSLVALIMNNCSIWFELIKGIPAVIVTLVIGGIATYIAWRQKEISGQQKEISQARLKLDLFDKRNVVFTEAWTFFSETLSLDANSPALHPFTNHLPQAGFLFGPEIADYLSDASTKRAELRMIYVLV